MYGDPRHYARGAKKEPALVLSGKKCYPDDIAVAVIPLDDVDSLLRKAGDAFAESHDGSLHSSDIVAMLAAIGVLPKKRAKNGGRK